jgi:hypothetical protein
MVSSEGACAAYYAYGRHLDSKMRAASALPAKAPPTEQLVQIGGAR